MDVADETVNVEFIGYPTNAQGNGAFPQVPILRLVECGTHTLVTASITCFREREQAMTVQLLTRFASV